MATITRNEVSNMLGVSVATVRRMEGKSLHPRLIDGAWRFAVDEVKNVQREPKVVIRRTPSEGEIAAEIFRRFDEGQSLPQIVLECRQSPRTVQALYSEWRTPLGEPSDSSDTPAMAMRDEAELVRWEEGIKSMIDADEEWEHRDREARKASRAARTCFRPYMRAGRLAPEL